VKEINIAIAIDLIDEVLEEYLKTLNLLDSKYNINYIKQSQEKPHITLCVGKINTEVKHHFIKLVEDFCIVHKEFTLETNGCALFLNSELNLFIRWHPSNVLKEFKLNLEEYLKSFWEENIEYNQFSYWIPKTSIAYKDLTYINLNKIDFLNIDFSNKKMMAKNISIIQFEKEKKEIIIKKLNLKG
jgi:2'-5' RNA ligase